MVMSIISDDLPLLRLPWAEAMALKALPPLCHTVLTRPTTGSSALFAPHVPCCRTRHRIAC